MTGRIYFLFKMPHQNSALFLQRQCANLVQTGSPRKLIMTSLWMAFTCQCAVDDGKNVEPKRDSWTVSKHVFLADDKIANIAQNITKYHF